MFQPKIRSKYQGIEPWQGDFHEGNVFSSENHFAPDMFRKSDISSASLTQSLLLLCLQSWSLQCIIDDTAVLSLCLAFVNAGVRLGCNWHCIGGSSPCPHWCTVQSSLLAPPGRGLTACLFLPAGILLQALVFCVINKGWGVSYRDTHNVPAIEGAISDCLEFALNTAFQPTNHFSMHSHPTSGSYMNDFLNFSIIRRSAPKNQYFLWERIKFDSSEKSFPSGTYVNLYCVKRLKVHISKGF